MTKEQCEKCPSNHLLGIYCYRFSIKKIDNIPECILLKNTEMKDSSDNILWELQLKENAASNMYTYDMLLVTDIRTDSI